MHIDVAFTPAEVQNIAAKVCLVVDVIRATSTLAVIASRRPDRLLITPTVQKAVKFAAQQAVHPVLCGERGGLAPEGFDYGNSPREFTDLDLTGKTVVFTSSNGARAIADVHLAPAVFLASFLNAGAAVEAALTRAYRDHLDVLVVCAGRDEKFAIDDAYCAGYLISLLLGLIPADKTFTLGEGGQAALALVGYFRDAEKLLRESGAGQAVIEIGLEEDIPFLLQKDLLNAVPTLQTRDRSPVDYPFTLLI